MKNLLKLSRNLPFRAIQKSDLREIDNLHKEQYPTYHIPDLINTIGDGIVYHDDKLVGFGIVKLRPECLIYLNDECDIRLRTATLLRLFEEAKFAGKSNHFDELIAVSFDPEYSNLLTKHLNFKSEHGRLMRLEI